LDLKIAGRRALVCGASKGLGFACAAALAAEGVAVTLVSRSTTALERARDRIAAQSSAGVQFVAADLATSEGRSIVLAACPDPDILITNCGGPPGGDFRQLTHGQWIAALEGNFLSAAELIRATVDKMAARGFGRIVNITSMTVRVPVVNLDLSNASRLALTGFVAGVSRQVASSGVTINSLLPGTIETERLRELGDTARRLVERVPMGRAGTPEEFGATCAYLCSVQAGFITGQNLLLDGGLCALTV
jgi:3-oxoacyl-[acyl-carrier protein] reductase